MMKSITFAVPGNPKDLAGEEVLRQFRLQLDDNWIPWEEDVSLWVIEYFQLPKSAPQWQKECPESIPTKTNMAPGHIFHQVIASLNEVAYGTPLQITDFGVERRYSLSPKVVVELQFHERPRFKKIGGLDNEKAK